MMKIQHQQLASGTWAAMPFCLQMANIGSEISRTIKWQEKGNQEYARKAFFRALELLDLTIAGSRSFSARQELLRTREALADHFMYNNIFNSTTSQWQKYFDQFAFLVAKRAAR
ncbi:MAG: hypothetical protein MUP98_01265 [Candidatus Aminicenantes bacterium]|nr:hypothetical protein [Candidatus Aminicenantes bacterium]